MRIRSLLLVSTVLAIGTPGIAQAANPRSVLFDLSAGRVGGLALGSASPSKMRARFGRPLSVEADRNLKGIVNYRYSCGSGCNLQTQIYRGKLVLAWAYLGENGSPTKRIRTKAGSYLGASRAFAERREGKRMQPGCVTELTKTNGRFTLMVSAGTGGVDGITLKTKGGAILC